MGKAGCWLDAGWFFACAVFSSLWCILAAQELGATFDEPVYLARGLEAWRTGSHSGLLRLGTMPLPIDVATLPLHIWERCQGTLIDPSADLDRVLPWARLGTLLFWWILLAYGWFAGRQIAGPWGGRLAVAWLAFEPNLLAHATLATTDIAISACLLALVYHFRTGRDLGWFWRVGLPGCWFAAAMSAKASGMVFGPLCMLAVELERLLSPGSQARLPDEFGQEASVVGRVARACRKGWQWLGSMHGSLAEFRRDIGPIAVIGFVLLFVYCGCDWRAEPSFVKWAHSLDEGPLGKSMVWFAEHLRIFSNAAEGLVRQVKHNVRGNHGTFLLGHVYPEGTWYYFAVALCIKLTLPLMAAMLLVGALKRRALANWACLAALALACASVTCRVQIGVRLVLPLVALAVVGLAAAVVQTVDENRSARGRWVVAAALGCAAWMGAIACQTWPHGLCYANPLWGGSERAYLLLSDSNYDWGQGAKELCRWQQARGMPMLDVWYFGTDPRVSQPPLRSVPLHALPIRQPSDVPVHLRPGYVAVSANLLYGALTSDAASPSGQAAAFFRARRPIDRTTTFFIYDLSPAAAGHPLQAARQGDRR